MTRYRFSNGKITTEDNVYRPIEKGKLSHSRAVVLLIVQHSDEAPTSVPVDAFNDETPDQNTSAKISHRIDEQNSRDTETT
jgi:hypothetical protein